MVESSFARPGSAGLATVRESGSGVNVEIQQCLDISLELCRGKVRATNRRTQ
jgi:hypothetical protein